MVELINSNIKVITGYLLMPKVRVRVRVFGVVQGVGFRFFTKRIADELGIEGYVMNLDDGSVEIVAEGEEKVINKFLEYVSRGPPGAVVEDMKVEYEEPKGEFKGFRIIYRYWGYW